MQSSASMVATTLAVAMRRAGAPAHRVEDGLAAFAEALGLHARFHVLPGAVLCDLEDGVSVVEVAAGAPDLERLGAIDEVAEAVGAGLLTAEQGVAALGRLAERPPRYPAPAVLVAYGLASASAAPFFGAGVVEVACAGAVGLVTGALAVGLGGSSQGHRLVEILAAALGAFLLAAAASRVPLAGDVALVTGLIVLLPGFALTVALTELATGHRLSGTGGLAAGGLVLLQLGFGTAVGSQVAAAWVGPAMWSTPAMPLPAWAAGVGLAGVAVAFAVLLQARPRHIPQVLGACALALVGAKLGTAWMGTELGVGLAALLVTVAANAMSRALRQPAAVWQLPGLLLLVPGSIGFRSVTALLAHDVTAGVEAAFGTAVACTALVGGSLVGSALVPPRRAL